MLLNRRKDHAFFLRRLPLDELFVLEARGAVHWKKMNLVDLAFPAFGWK